MLDSLRLAVSHRHSNSSSHESNLNRELFIEHAYDEEARTRTEDGGGIARLVGFVGMSASRHI